MLTEPIRFDPDSPEAQTALLCDSQHVTIPGYGVVDMAVDEIIDGEGAVYVYFLDRTR